MKIEEIDINLLNDKECRPYHKDNSCYGLSGYYGFLDDAQEAALNELKELVTQSIDKNDLSEVLGKEHINLALLRFLRARDFDVAKAFTMFDEHVQWYKSENISALKNLTAEEILGCDPEALNQYYPHWFSGMDEQNRPVFFKKYGGFEVWNIKKIVPLENVVRYHIWEQIKAEELLQYQSESNGYTVETFCIIVDVKHMRLGQVTKDFLWLIKQTANIDQNHFPERLGALYLINTPGAFPFVWRGIQPWLSPNTTRKIQIYSSEEEWKPILLQVIGQAILPEAYGGEGKEIDFALFGKHSMENIIQLNSNNTEEKKELIIVNKNETNSSNEWSKMSQASNETTEFYDVNSSSTPNDNSSINSNTVNSQKEIRLIIRILDFINVLSIICSIVTISFGSYVLSNMIWTSVLVEWLMWSCVVLVVFGSLELIATFVGYLAARTQTLLVLQLFITWQYLVGVALFVISIICFNAEKVLKISWKAVEKAVPSTVTKYEIENLINKYSILLGTASLCLCISSILQIVVSHVLENRLKRNVRKPIQKETEYRMILRLSNMILIAFAVVCIGYGGYALRYSLEFELTSFVFTPYLLLEFGILLLLVTIVGFWVSSVSAPWVAAFYSSVLVPLIFFFTIGGILSFCEMAQTDREVKREYDSSHMSSNPPSINNVQVGVKTSLLVTGIIEIVTNFFLLVNLFATYQLHKIFLEKNNQFSTNIIQEWKRLNKLSQLVCAWAISIGLIHIFLDGSHVIFNRWLTSNPTGWFVAIWTYLGTFDTRFIDSDAFLVASEAFLAIFIGPVCLFFGWAVFLQKPYQHILAIFICSAEVYSQVLYYSTEIHMNFVDFKRPRSAGFWIYFIVSNLMKLIIPLFILFYSFKTSHSDQYEKEKSQKYIRTSFKSANSKSFHSFNSIDLNSDSKSFSTALNVPFDDNLENDNTVSIDGSNSSSLRNRKKSSKLSLRAFVNLISYHPNDVKIFPNDENDESKDDESKDDASLDDLSNFREISFNNEKDVYEIV